MTMFCMMAILPCTVMASSRAMGRGAVAPMATQLMPGIWAVWRGWPWMD